jgi:hypothetical protein
MPDRPALSPPEIFYQRMLAGDPTEAAEKAEEFLKERSLASYYDEVALKGLQLAQADAERGALDEERLTKIRDAVREFASDLSDQNDRPSAKGNSTTDAEASSAIESVAENASHENMPIISKKTLCLSQIKSGHICDGVRRGLDGKEYALLSQRSAIGAHPYPRPGACASHYSNSYTTAAHDEDAARQTQQRGQGTPVGSSQ